MDREQWQKIKKILQEAIELPVQERVAFLDEACAGDQELRREVESLLARSDQTGGFLDRPAIEEVAEEIVADRSPSLAGRAIAHYRIESVIGAGGMGEVYQAYDEKLQRKVAVKFLPAEFVADPDRVLQFAREAHAASALNHPNIITVYDIGQATITVNGHDEEVHYIACELIEGRTLRHRINESRLDWPEAVGIAAQITDALAAAHAAGIIHRDIKPENVMLRNDGLVKVLDFGIAKRFDIPEQGAQVGEDAEKPPTAENPTLAGRHMTLDYASPEQARLEKTDAKTDIFSFGLVLYEMLTGHQPFAGKTREQKQTALLSEDEMPRISEICKDIPASLRDLVTNALRKNPAERQASMNELLETLRELKPLEKSRATRQTLKSIKTGNANRILNQSVSFYAADKNKLLSLLTLWTIWRHSDIERGSIERELIRKSLINQLLRALAVALPILVLTALLSITEEWTEQSDGLKAAVRRAVFSPQDGRLVVSVGEDKQVIVWDFAQRKRLKTFTDHTGWVTSVAFSPDGKLFATGSHDGTVIVWDTAQLKKVAVLSGHQEWVHAVAFSPDGCLLASASRGETGYGKTILWDVGRWEKVRELPQGSDYSNILFSSDSRILMLPNGQWDVSTGQKVSRDQDWESWNWAEFSRDGRRLVKATNSGNADFWELARPGEIVGGRRIDRIHAHQDSGRAATFSPDGKLAATGSENVVLWDVAARTILGRLEYDSAVWSVVFSPDGHWLVSTHGDGAILVWDVAERRRSVGFDRHGDAVLAVAISPDGKRIASAGEDRSVAIWDAESNQKETVLIGHQTRVIGLAFSPDGKWLASSDQDGKIIRWDLETQQPRWSVETRHSVCLAVSPNGQWIAASRGVYESDTGREVFSLYHPPMDIQFQGVAFSTDSHWLAGVKNESIFLIDTTNWQALPQQKKTNESSIIGVSFSPDGTKLVTGSDEGTVALWQTHPLSLFGELGKHKARIKAVAFSYDGSEVVSCGDDKQINLWDVGRRKLIRTIGEHSSPVYAVAFSHDGKHIVSGEHDRTERIYTRHRTLWGWRLD